jgi:MULE transposase domain
MEYSVSGLCAMIDARQRSDYFNNTSKFFFIDPAEKSIQFAGSENSRVQVFITTETLLRNVQRVYDTAGVRQLAMDSKHRVLMNNYPVTDVGVLDAGQQFNLIALAVSNKEDKNMYSAFIQGIETVLQSIDVQTDPECTISDNSDAIQKSFMRYYPNSSIGGCFFHLLQNIKKKRNLWNIYVPPTISSTLKSRFIIRARDARERFAQEALRWLSSLSFIHEFTLFSAIFIQLLHAQGDQELSDTLRAEYFQGIKRGWARCMMPCGSAGTNNSLEAFNGSVLERDIVAGSRMTIAQFLESVEGLLRQQSEIFTEKSPPLSPLDVRRTVRASSHMKQGVKAWYAKEMALDD